MGRRRHEGPPVLSPRQREALAALAEGCTRPQIADRLGLSVETVRTHLKAAYRKLGARNGASAAARFVAGGPG